MTTLAIVTSNEYHMNQPRVFTQINGSYVGCKIYPHSRNYPAMSYWANAHSSDSDRSFELVEKQFNNEEIAQILLLQQTVDCLSKLIPDQPKWEYISSSGFKIRRGKAYRDYVEKTTAQRKEQNEYFESIRVFNDALNKAHRDLRLILNK